MPRQARIVIPGELFHLTQRGNYKQHIFEDNDDRAHYINLFEEYKNKYGLHLYAFCLMNNHIHCIVQPMKMDSMAQTICRCHQQYSIYFHKKREIQGHLWQERFYSCVLYGDHIRQAIRYVERNPVRAGIVEQPWNYVWSSARAHLGTQYKALTLADASKYIGNALEWKTFLIQDDKEEEIKRIRESTLKGTAVGDEQDIRALTDQIDRDLTPRPVGRPKKNKIVTGTISWFS